jgi:hypothetical protein
VLVADAALGQYCQLGLLESHMERTSKLDILFLLHQPRRDDIPELHQGARRDKNAHRVPDRARIVIVGATHGDRFILLAVCALPFASASLARRLCAPSWWAIYDPLHLFDCRCPLLKCARPRDDVFVEGRIFSRRDGVAEGVPEDGVCG